MEDLVIEKKTFAILTTKTYSRTDSGKSWKSKPDEETTEQITKQNYVNITGSATLKFFRRMGGSKTVTRGYTSEGYIPVKLSSIPFTKHCKRIHTFKIVGNS